MTKVKDQLLSNLSSLGLGMPREKVVLKDHNEAWLKAYTLVARHLANVTGSSTAWHHVGSTSIPAIGAKPILDVLGVAENIEVFDNFRGGIESLGFTWKGEYGIPGRRYSVLYDNEEKVGFVHLHVFAQNDPEVAKHLLFRDYLCAFPDVAREYEKCKSEMAEKFNLQREKYTEGKSNLISDILKRASVWRQQLSNANIQIRIAKKDDALPVAKVNVSGWLRAYRGIMPDELLDSLDPKARAERSLSTGFPQYPNGGGFTFVAEVAGVIVGYVQGGPSRDATGTDGEVYAIYVDAARIGTGIGRHLFGAALSELKARKFNSAAARVLEGNFLARQFYQRQGGTLSDFTKNKEFGGKLLREVVYSWRLT